MKASTYPIQSYGLSHQGNVRDHNEDHFLDLSAEGVWVVADGAGGHDRGEVASRLIIEGLQTIKASNLLGKFLETIDKNLQTTNQQLIQMRERPGAEGILGSTVCVLVIHGNQGVCLWAGDSRIYLLRHGALKLLTHDHNRMDEFRSAGFTDQELAKYPVARQLVHAVGVEAPLFLEMKMQECCSGDVFLVCSDGLHGELEDKTIEYILNNYPQPQAAAQALVQRVLEGKAKDNVTALVIQLTTTA